MLGYMLYSAWDQLREDRDEYRHQARILARLVADEQTQLIGQARQTMAAHAVNGGRAGSVLLGENCAPHLRSLVLEHPLFSQMSVLDPAGRALCTAHPVHQPARVGDQAYFQAALRSRSFALSGVLTDRWSGKRVIHAAQPLLDERGEVVAVLGAALDLRWLARMMGGIALPHDALVSLVDSTGQVLAHYPDQLEELGLRVPVLGAFLRIAAREKEGFIEAPDIDYQERVIAYARVDAIPGAPIFARVGIPVGEIRRGAMRSLRTGFLALVALLGVTGFAAWFGADRLVARPLRRLQEEADRLGRGDLAARTGLPHADGEVGRLAQKLDELAEHLQRANRALRALSAGNRTLLRERDEASLLTAMCEVVVEVGGYPCAFVTAARDDRERSVEIMAQAGNLADLLARLGLTWADGERGQGSVAQAIRTGRTAIIRDVASAPRTAPARDALLEHGIRSTISLPVNVFGKLTGTFTIFAAEAGAFDGQEVELLEEMAADLSFGIETIRDRTRREAAEGEARRAETHDALTGLPNRTAFLAHVARLLESLSGHGEPVAVLTVHLPHLTDVYDGLGYDPGSRIVVLLADRLRECFPTGQVIGRLVDEFGVLLPGSDAEGARRAADAIIAALREPVRIGDALIEMRVVVGASFYPGHGDAADLLLRRSTIAAREAARRDLGYFAYRGSTERENPARLALAGELRLAIERRELAVHFQTKYTLESGQLAGLEALARWPHATKGMIPPGLFVQVAEHTGLVRALTYFVIDATVRQLRAWYDEGVRIPVAINLSARTFYDPGLAPYIDGLLNTWGLPGELLEFEITESALVDDPETARGVLQGLSALGSKLYIDDFGTGYSSLSYLVTLPVHALKIDRAFISQIGRSEQARSVVASVISMAHGLGLRVVAEGVEEEADRHLLRSLGCDEAQGYHFGKPMPARELTELLATEARRKPAG
jgi:diguanylate cyclase (GGDEF)-like protein